MSLNVVRRGAVFLSFTPHFLPLSDVRFFWHLGNPGAFLVAQLVKNLPEMWVTWAWSLGWEDSPGEGKGGPLQYSGLENSMDCIVHGVAKSPTWLSFSKESRLRKRSYWQRTSGSSSRAPTAPCPGHCPFSSNGELVTDLPFYSFQEAWGLLGFESLSCQA